MVRTAPSPSNPSPGSYFDNVVIIVMENHGINQIIGSAPYMTALANTYSLAKSYTALEHPSEPNYLGLISGQTFNPPSGNDSYQVFSATNLVDRLESAGLTWRAYSETASGPCDTGNSDIRHIPFLFFADVVNNAARCNRVVPTTAGSAGEMIQELNSASPSNFIWLTPNDCNNMHDCLVSTGDSYLATIVPKILSSNTFTTKRAALFVTFDEGNNNFPSDYVYSVWAGPGAKPAYSSTTKYSHYSFLRTVEANWNLQTLTSNDAGAPLLTEFFPTAPLPAPLSTSFTASPSASQANTQITFTSTTTGGASPYTVSWNFGDGSTGIGATVTHTYSSAQTFTATEFAKDSSTPQKTATTSQAIVVTPAISGNFGGCADLPRGWSCGNAIPFASSVTIANGVVETRQLNPGVGNDTNYYYATTQKGTFPWDPCRAPASGAIPSGVTSVSAAFTLLGYDPGTRPSNDRYHVYVALYYWLPNGNVSAGGSTYRCLDTQVRVENVGGTFSPAGTTATYDPGDSFGWDQVTLSNINLGQTYSLTANVSQQCQRALAAWGLPMSTPCQLAGIEIGTEGFQFQELDVNWSNVNLVITQPQSLTASATSTSTSPQTGQLVSFSATATGGTFPYSYVWSFGDGSTTTGSPVSHIYQSKGNYTVNLTVRDNIGGTVSTSLVVRVSARTLLGDLDGNCIVDIKDAGIISMAYGTAVGQTRFNSLSDLNHDGVVNILDAAILAVQYGLKC